MKFADAIRAFELHLADIYRLLGESGAEIRRERVRRGHVVCEPRHAPLVSAYKGGRPRIYDT